MHPITHKQFDHGLTAVPALAMDVLEEIKRCGTAAVECLDVSGFQFELRGVAQIANEAADDFEVPIGQQAFLAQNALCFCRLPPEFRHGVAQQRGKNPKGEHNPSYHFARSPLVRLVSRPNRLNSLLPSLQPSPKLKPHVPRSS